MLHRVAGKKLGRTKNQRRSLFRNLANSLILHEKIVTTEAKAKAVKPMVEKMVTKAKTNSIHNRRLLLKELPVETTVNKLLEVVGPKFKDRPGGYLKIVRLGTRVGDRAEMVVLTFVEDFSSVALEKAKVKESVTIEKKSTKKPAKTVKKPAKVKKDNGKDTD